MKTSILFGFATLIAGAAHAAPIAVESYDMPNGTTGSFQYWDESYVGTTNPVANNSPLTGGTGDLTDGVIAMDGWLPLEQPSGPGPYVGWLQPRVTITFHFDGVQTFNSLTVWYDDSDGLGGVDHLDLINVAETSSNFVLSDPGPAPFASATIPLAGLVSDVVTVTFYGATQWIFISEVQFDGVVSNEVPIPAAALLFGAAVPFALRRKRR